MIRTCDFYVPNVALYQAELRPEYANFIFISPSCQFYDIIVIGGKIMNDIMNLINKISYPLVLFGAINYGLIGLFQIDMLAYFDSAMLLKLAQIIIGFAGVGVAVGLLGRK